MTLQFVRTWTVRCALALLVFPACSGTSSSSTDGAVDGTSSDADTSTSDGFAGATGSGGAAAGTIGTDGGAGVGTPDASPDGDAAALEAGGDVAAIDAGDAGDAGDAVLADGGDTSANASLCAPMNVTPSNAIVTNVSTGATAPAASTYTGGPIAAATYALTSVTHYGAAYTGPPQALYIFDPANHTLRIAETFGGGVFYFLGLTTTSPDAHTLVGTVVCNSSSFNFTSFTWSYTATATTTTLTLSPVGSPDVMVYTKQ
jgi:hypothetical protein